MEKKSLRTDIKQALLEQLERNGTLEAYYVDLVNDYMELWETKNMLVADIKARGAVVEYISNNGTVNKRKNESVGELVKVNDRMLKLLDGIGVAPVPTEGDIDEM